MRIYYPVLFTSFLLFNKNEFYQLSNNRKSWNFIGSEYSLYLISFYWVIVCSLHIISTCLFTSSIYQKLFLTLLLQSRTTNIVKFFVSYLLLPIPFSCFVLSFIIESGNMLYIKKSSRLRLQLTPISLKTFKRLKG